MSSRFKVPGRRSAKRMVGLYMREATLVAKADISRALVRTFVARTVAALGSLGLFVVLGRVYGVTGVGVYALAYGFLMGAGILARMGMDNGLMKYIGQSYKSPNVLRYLLWALGRAVILSLVACVGILVFRHLFEQWFASPGLASTLIGIALAIPAYAACFLFSGFFKGVRMPATASLLESGSISLLAGLGIVGYEWGIGKSELSVIGYAYAVAAWIVALQGAALVWLWCRRQDWYSSKLRSSKLDLNTSSKEPSFSQFMVTSRAFFISSLAGFMQTVLGLMIAAKLLSATELGLFKTSQQITILIGFILIVINSVLPPRFASLYFRGDISATERLARNGALFGLLAAAPIFVVCLAFPAWVLSWLGPDFVKAENLLQIIAVAQLFNVATGSVGFLLNMTGHEKLMRNIALICNALGLLAFFILPQVFGALGAALALSIVLMIQNLIAMLYVWKRLSIWILPGSNFLRWINSA